ncbi:MAG TPA: thioesterase domain-containing protein [Gemmatimonadaceae bacterium]
MGRWRANGTIEYLGRNDQQVKIRGHRIELGEVEARLLQHPALSAAAVIAREDKPGDKRLVAYVVVARGDADDPAAIHLVKTLREHVARQLPEYMVPAAIVKLDALPLTDSGKLDLRALPAPDMASLVQQAYEAPRGSAEVILAELWAELLGVERVGRDDHFFDLGGNSLTAVRLMGRLRRLELGTDVRTLFEMPVLREFAKHISHHHYPSGASAVPVHRSGAKPPVFFVPDGFGGYAYVFALANNLDRDLQVYALPWEDKEQEPILTLEERAANLIASMKEIQRRGPYRLAGYSEGGLLAYAIGQRLFEDREVASFVGLIDTRLHVASPSTAHQILAGYIRFHLSDAVSRDRFLAIVDHLSLAELLDEAQRLGVPMGQHDANAGHWEQVANFHRGVSAFQPAPIPCGIHLFHSTELLKPAAAAKSAGDECMDHAGASASEDSLGWERVLPPSLIYRLAVPGDHLSMMKTVENRRRLGAAISKALVHSDSTRHRPVRPGS